MNVTGGGKEHGLGRYVVKLTVNLTLEVKIIEIKEAFNWESILQSHAFWE